MALIPKRLFGFLLFFVLQSACNSSSKQWENAKQMWNQRDFHAYKVWMDIDPNSPEGTRSRRLLKKANTHYLSGIRAFQNNDPKAAREWIKQGANIAPLNPIHFLALGQILFFANLYQPSPGLYHQNMVPPMLLTLHNVH